MMERANKYNPKLDYLFVSMLHPESLSRRSMRKNGGMSITN